MSKSTEIILSVMLILIGFCMGSFLNVLIYRLPEKMSILTPPSHCPSCGKKIRWYDNIPLLSYIILRGKCRSCKSKISPIYFFVELFNAILWLAILLIFGISIYSVLFMFTSSLLIAIAFIDFKHQIIPNSLNIAIAVIGVIATVYGVFYPTYSSVLGEITVLWWERLLGCVGGGLLFATIYYIYFLLHKKEGLGGGDVKFIAACGLILGYKSTLLCIGLSAILACIFIIIMKIAKKLNTDKPFAFGPFLSAAVFIVLIVGDCIINAYLNLF